MLRVEKKGKRGKKRKKSMKKIKKIKKIKKDEKKGKKREKRKKKTHKLFNIIRVCFPMQENEWYGRRTRILGTMIESSLFFYAILHFRPSSLMFDEKNAQLIFAMRGYFVPLLIFFFCLGSSFIDYCVNPENHASSYQDIGDYCTHILYICKITLPLFIFISYLDPTLLQFYFFPYYLNFFWIILD